MCIRATNTTLRETDIPNPQGVLYCTEGVVETKQPNSIGIATYPRGPSTHAARANYMRFGYTNLCWRDTVFGREPSRQFAQFTTILQP